MKKNFLILGFFILGYVGQAVAWEPVGNKIKTRWAAKVTPENVWQEYPRPQLRRQAWQNLNGLWEYAIGEKEGKRPARFDGQILVPFGVESSLSGVGKTVRPEDKIWYRRQFEVNPAWKGQNILLHFEAVDWKTTVWVNGKQVGVHCGGSDAFSFDITKYLKSGGKQELVVSVWDPTDAESYARGKQQLNQSGIWYTPVSGIWQTVWLEPVNKNHITRLVPVADIGRHTVVLNSELARKSAGEEAEVRVTKEGKEILCVSLPYSPKMELSINNPELWSPEHPHLYHFTISLKKNGKEIDRVNSYFAMRKISKQQDRYGYFRTYLNDKPIFQMGTLDQGWWPDGLLTPPSAEAMIWDMVRLKEMGFNTLRKHIKVEPALYYYYADSLGLMVWQDMPSAMETADKKAQHVSLGAPDDWVRPAENARQWETEVAAIIRQLEFFPSITTWVIFNEGWGQYDTRRVVEWAMTLDTTRLFNGVSGWTDRNVGDFYDVHNYPSVAMKDPRECKGRISVLGEFGGLGLPLQGHLWNPEMRNWGYRNMGKNDELIRDYVRLISDLEILIPQGLSAAIYTQTTDVEGEVNGLISYDREVVKIPVELLHLVHARLYTQPSLKMKPLIQEGAKNPVRREIALGNEPYRMEQMPFKVDKKTKVASRTSFRLEEIPAMLALRLNTQGMTKIRINGKKVFEQNVKRTPYFNQFNLTEYIGYLKLGENVFEIETDFNGAKRPFDYGLWTGTPQ